MADTLTIGQVAERTGLPPSAIRFYEGRGLLPLPERSEAGYRRYTATDVRRLRLIKRAKLLGLSLPAVKELVEETFTDTCTYLQETLLRRIPGQLAEVDARIAELQVLRRDLAALHEHLERLNGALPSDPVAECENCPCIAGGEGR